MTPTHLTLVTISVGRVGHVWAWEVDGPGGMLSGSADTQADARTAAGEAAVTVLGRLEVPRGGGDQLAAALQGPRVLP